MPHIPRPPSPSSLPAPIPTARFDYALPEELIAQQPCARRDGSRLLVVDRTAHSIAHHHFAELPQFLRAGDTLFRNNAAVLPARLHAQRRSGGQVECFLLRPEAASGANSANAASQGAANFAPEATRENELASTAVRSATPSNARGEVWRCLLRPSKRLPVGETFEHTSGDFSGEVLAKETDGTALVRLRSRSGQSVPELARRLGSVPLPPYIQRPKEGEGAPAALASAASTDAGVDAEAGTQRAQDLARYQTVYADDARPVAVAAPTAGLHFTPQLLTQLAARGVELADLTLHVGLGTFRPIAADTIQAHEIHRELYEIPPATLGKLHRQTGRRIAVGTTSLRSIEHYLRTKGRRAAAGPPANGRVASDHSPAPTSDSPHAAQQAQPAPTRAHIAEADLFVYPPAQFLGVDALLTNFHQPRSTLLCLVAAFLAPGSTAGIDWLHEIYAEAIAQRYRFFSYGDAMLIL